MISKRTIIVKDLLGINLITIDDGQPLHEEIYHDLANGYHVTLDFIGVKIIATPFINAAIGQLYRSFNQYYIAHHLEFTNIPPLSELIIKNTIENAIRYHNDPEYQQAVDTTIINLGEED